MDDLVGILFYILIIVLGGIISAYRNKNKRKKMTPPLSKPVEEPALDEIPPYRFDPFEEFSRKYELNTEEPEVNPEVESEITPALSTDSLETIVDMPEEEGITVSEETREVMQSDAEQGDNMITSSQISDMVAIDETQKHEFINLRGNIKQAIIYSEILKRKHF